ncbi:MAG: bifunctional aspartate kinase/homoserine dehydrogenase I [Treponema sp.]|jgi:aspartokinase/homoserine dehydrogenase 1|nr:bifunctional aspartate kinase/homoserine dehydrogenase I [Treponema sp.]
MLVLKFGGTSVGSIEGIQQILTILSDTEHKGRVRAVVVSALSGITDSLIKAAQTASLGNGAYLMDLAAMKQRHLDLSSSLLKGPHKEMAETFIESNFKELARILDGVVILKELSPRILDYIMSFGECLSAFILSQVCSYYGVPADFFDARQAVVSDGRFGQAAFLPEETYRNIQSKFEERKNLQIVTGFIASSLSGETTTLGRGGSDLSAAIFAAAINADEAEIWTDVDGILTADPKQVKNAFKIDSISYVEALELSHFGAKILHPPAVRPALEKGIPIRIRNTFNTASSGTIIAKEAEPSAYPIRGISSMNNIALLRIQGTGMVGVAGFSSRLFGSLARKKISVILITQSSSEYSICFAVMPKDAEAAARLIKEEFQWEIQQGVIDKPVIEKDLSIIAVVGERMKQSPGIAGKVFHALGRNGVNIVAIAQGSSELNISAVIPAQDEKKALNAIHEAFFLSGLRSVNLFLIGIGLIGGTLLEQLAAQKEVLAEEHKIRINLVGVANSRKMIFNVNGLNPKKVKALLDTSDTASAEIFDLDEFVKKMDKMNLPNSAFCDCTASNNVPSKYLDILKFAIPVVTPNKRANSGPYDFYQQLTSYSRDRGIPYLYETTVCAGLPVISTLRDFTLSGDKVRRIEAVLSGTLSFIFNNYDGSKPFSELVMEAKTKGYTEPDPRDDLNAMDAARKALILARECGMQIEADAVTIEPILPAACFEAPSVDAFFEELKKHDDEFEARRANAAKSGKQLRYAAVIEEGKAVLSLREEAEGSPFRSLVDSDNIVVITSDRYSTLPLVVKGPGAGAQVTAGGVFADIVRIARTLV